MQCVLELVPCFMGHRPRTYGLVPDEEYNTYDSVNFTVDHCGEHPDVDTHEHEHGRGARDARIVRLCAAVRVPARSLHCRPVPLCTCAERDELRARGDVRRVWRL